MVGFWSIGYTFCPGDVTTQNAPVGSPNHGVPDGLVTGTDISYYVNNWIAGCP